MLLLVFVFIFSNIYIKTWAENPLISIAGCHATKRRDFQRSFCWREHLSASYGFGTDAEAKVQSPWYSWSSALCRRNCRPRCGRRTGWIHWNFSAIKRWFSFFTETNDLSLEGIFYVNRRLFRIFKMRSQDAIMPQYCSCFALFHAQQVSVWKYILMGGFKFFAGIFRFTCRNV